MLENLPDVKRMLLATRSGIRLWLNEDESEKVKIELEGESRGFLEIQGMLIARNDITGILSPEAAGQLQAQDGGFWQCEKKWWHRRGTLCDCKINNV